MKIEEQVLSREQMAHLKELGVDTSDASMMWYHCDDSHIERLYELFCWVAENHKELIK